MLASEVALADIDSLRIDYNLIKLDEKVLGEGVGYNRFHTTAMCSPTRASLLTGRNHHRVGYGQIAELANDWDGYSGHIPKSSATVAEVLELADRTGPGLAAADEAAARAHFVTTSRYEWMFFDAAYRREAWPV